MPILAIETFFTQFFWLFVVLFVFNDFILNTYVPGIAKIMKAREETSSYTSKDIVESSINIELPLFNLEGSSNLKNFTDTRVNWIKKQSK